MIMRFTTHIDGFVQADCDECGMSETADFSTDVYGDQPIIQLSEHVPQFVNHKCEDEGKEEH